MEQARYRVLQRAFIDGRRVEPGKEIVAPKGLDGSVLELLPEQKLERRAAKVPLKGGKDDAGLKELEGEPVTVVSDKAD